MDREQRGLKRWEINSPARIRLRYKNSVKNFQCLIKNINFKGFHVCVKKDLPELETLKLTVILPGNDSFTAKVKVIWRKVSPEGILYGLNIIAMKDSQRNLIYQLINKNYYPQLIKLWWKDAR